MSAAEIEAALPLLKKVPYSLHSSFPELASFVTYLQPQAIVPVVKRCYDSRYPIHPNAHFKHLLSTPQPCSGFRPQQGAGLLKQKRKRETVKAEPGTLSAVEAALSSWQVRNHLARAVGFNAVKSIGCLFSTDTFLVVAECCQNQNSVAVHAQVCSTSF